MIGLLIPLHELVFGIRATGPSGPATLPRHRSWPSAKMGRTTTSPDLEELRPHRVQEVPTRTTGPRACRRRRTCAGTAMRMTAMTMATTICSVGLEDDRARGASTVSWGRTGRPTWQRARGGIDSPGGPVDLPIVRWGTPRPGACEHSLDPLSSAIRARRILRARHLPTHSTWAASVPSAAAKVQINYTTPHDRRPARSSAPSPLPEGCADMSVHSGLLVETLPFGQSVAVEAEPTASAARGRPGPHHRLGSGGTRRRRERDPAAPPGGREAVE